MNFSSTLTLLCLAGLGLATEVARAADEDVLMTRIQPSSEQTIGRGRSALWTLPVVATQYVPVQPTAAMRAALMAQQEGRFLDALIQLDEASKLGAGGPEATLLRASFLLQGNQSRQAVESLAPLLAGPHAASAWALTAMAHLQQGQMSEALAAAQKAQGLKDGTLASLAMSYALQGQGKLAEARQTMHEVNARGAGGAQSPIALAREAELALTVDQLGAARSLVGQARDKDAAHPYVVAVGGLVALIDGSAAEAKAAFEAALRRDPQDAKALFGLGLAEIRLGSVAAGQAKLLAADDADPGNALILTYLGRSQLSLGQTEAARASWRKAQQADPRDPVPWLYLAQTELLANRPQDARVSLREARARLGYRAVYRGERLLREDEQLLEVHLAEVQRQLGNEKLAFQTLATTVGARSSANLRSQAEVLQGQRFGESARRSLALQSLFNERPGNLPVALDHYGDGLGLLGAGTPQRGFISQLGAQQASYNNYDELFSRPTRLDAEANGGGRNTVGDQLRAGFGGAQLGIGLAHLRFSTDGFAPDENLDNRAFQAILQWRPEQATQIFLSRQNFDSDWGGVFYPAQPWAMRALLADSSQVTRLGLRRSLSEDGSREIWGLLSRQGTDSNVHDTPFAYRSGSSARSEEFQYRQSGPGYATQWGVLQVRAHTDFDYASGGSAGYTRNAQQFYATWQQALHPAWQVEAGLGWGRIEQGDYMGDANTYLRHWLPQLGVVYAPDASTHVRAAAWQGLGTSGLGDATLAPASLAGILLTRPDDINSNGLLVRAQAVAVDRQLNADWLLIGEAQRRKFDLPMAMDPETGSLQQIMLYGRVDEARLGLHWQPQAQPWALSLSSDYEHLRHDLRDDALDSVHAQSLHAQQVEFRWFAGPQWTTSLALSHNRVAGSQRMFSMTSFATVFPEYRSSFNQVDASVNWKFGGPLGGQLTAGVRNVADSHFQYTEIDKLNPRFSSGRLMYARIRLAW